MVSKQMEKQVLTNQTKVTVENVDIPIGDESNLLTQIDVDRARKGEPPLQYDAYLLYENSDAPFAAQLFHKMKDVYSLEVIYTFTIIKIYYIKKEKKFFSLCSAICVNKMSRTIIIIINYII